jgi:hypothetical protein
LKNCSHSYTKKLSASGFYLLISVLLIIGWMWIFFNFNYNYSDAKGHEVCLFKMVTGIPCPSCGSTRSAINLLKGNWFQGFYINPLGIIVTLFMLAVPFWLLYDVALGKDGLFRAYKSAEKILRTKWAIPLIILLVINWIWSISKGL